MQHNRRWFSKIVTEFFVYVIVLYEPLYFEEITSFPIMLTIICFDTHLTGKDSATHSK